LRDGLILRFEFTYELCHRLLRRYLRMVAASPEIYDQMPFQDPIRTGNEQGLLRSDWPAWRRFRDMRARTSHDLALEWDGPLGFDVLGMIAEALSESDLHYKVDIVDLALVDPAFRARILNDCVRLAG
jgi:hypothetical protein